MAEPLDEEKLNMAIRKFLKKVGVTSQREIEIAARKMVAEERIKPGTPVKLHMQLVSPELGLDHTLDEEITIE
jgi:hypothetical protein